MGKPTWKKNKGPVVTTLGSVYLEKGFFGTCSPIASSHTGLSQAAGSSVGVKSSPDTPAEMGLNDQRSQ